MTWTTGRLRPATIHQTRASTTLAGHEAVKEGVRAQEATWRIDRTDQSRPPSCETENTTALVRAGWVGGRLPSVAAITPALPTNLGRSKRASEPLGIRIVARLQWRPPSWVENTRPFPQRAIHPVEGETKRIGAKQGSPGDRTWPGGPDARRFHVRPPSFVPSRSPPGAFGLTGSIQPCSSSVKLRKVGPPPQLCVVGLPSDCQERPPSLVRYR